MTRRPTRRRRHRRFPAAGLLLVLPALAALVFFGCRPRREATPPAAPTAAPGRTAVAETAPDDEPPAFDANVFEPLSVRAQTARVPVLMYHDIIEERTGAAVYFDCTREEFVAQLDFLVEKGAQPISLEQLHRHLVRGEPVPENAIVLTFDDNYQGFYDIAYPLLKERNFPAAVFVHTNFVGDKTGAHPKMDWDTLRALDKEGLVTIGSHTLSHPDDMGVLPPETQDKELREAKAVLERELGHPVPYFAYPNGKGDEKTFELAQAAGYTMAFTIRNGPAEESPDVLQVHRYIHTRLEKAWEEHEATVGAPAAVVDLRLGAAAPVKLAVGTWGGVKLGLVYGGRPASVRTPTGRKSVGDFIQQTSGGVAGINGTFFADAALRGTDNTMIGPCQTGGEGAFLPEAAEWRLPRLQNRPVVLWGPTRFAIFPFQATAMNTADPYRAFMPDYSDLFVAGGWIVRSGVARTEEEMRPFAVGDMNDYRRRAFLGLTQTGQIVLGGSLEVVTTAKLAQAAAEAGVVEAVLLDSGFSTSLVYDNKIIVTGHTARHLPSRPVPHAIVLTGTLSPPTNADTKRLLEEAEQAAEPAPPAPPPTPAAPPPTPVGAGALSP